MNYFEIVLAALDALVDGICRHRQVDRTVAMKMAAKHLQTMREEWFTGETPNIAYEDPLCRFAYLYCHTAVNANLCEHCIKGSKKCQNLIHNLFNQNGELRICAFGGGPGTELLAMAKYLCNHPEESPGEISFTLLDIVEEWSESWNALERAIKSRLREKYGARNNWPFSVSKTFLPFDMTQVEKYANVESVLTHDLYILNYVISELYGNDDAFRELFIKMAESAPSQAIFLVIDRSQNSVIEMARGHMAAAGLEIDDLYKTSDIMDMDEQSKTLNEYKALIGRDPRVRWKGAFRLVGVKP